MTTKTITIPSGWLEGIDLTEANVRRALLLGVAQMRQEDTGASEDPVLALAGQFASDQSLIDGIAVSEDPDLYVVAETLGDHAWQLHAWEIAPARYLHGADGRAIRRG